MGSHTAAASIKKEPILLILAAVTIASINFFFIVSKNYYRVGFPLDDAWIHQTYARSLAQLGKWEFFPGQSSAGGSTSPLWSMLLAIGYILKINNYLWGFLLGGGFLFGTASLAEWTIRRILPEYHTRVPWVGILFSLEWHFVWAALSGMETILQIFLTTLFFAFIIALPEKDILLGFIVGLSVWVRPDGATLLLPLYLNITLTASTPKNRLIRYLKSGLGFAALAIPYLGFNIVLSGSLLPNTFYAKQAEYAALQSVPLIQRFFEQWLQPLTGVGLILIPSSILYLFNALRNKRWAIASYYIWPVVFMALYALRLPVTYQHGRYGMPVMPLLFLFGALAGTQWITTQRKNQKLTLVFQRVWQLSIGLICVSFFIIGAWSYARDVAYVESEMVETAQWIAVNIPDDKLIAAHDIGALGYFGSHRIIDLAGLISPEVIPIIRNQEQLALFLNLKDVDYLVAFPKWYPDLVYGKNEVYSARSTAGQSYGGEQLTVYRWK